MKKELALSIVRLNGLITDQEYQCQALKDALKELKERREALLRELVALVSENDA